MKALISVASADLSKRESRLILLIHVCGGKISGVSLEDLVQATGLPKSGVSQTITDMACAGFITVVKDGIRIKSIKLNYGSLAPIARENKVLKLRTSQLPETLPGSQNKNVFSGEIALCSQNENVYPAQAVDFGYAVASVTMKKKGGLGDSSLSSSSDEGGRIEESITKQLSNLESASAESLFTRFWRVYPRKVNPKGCAKKWKTAKLDEAFDLIIADINRRLDAGEWKVTKKEKGFIPHPLTYLNQERWLEEFEGGDEGVTMDDGQPDWTDNFEPEGGWK